MTEIRKTISDLIGVFLKTSEERLEYGPVIDWVKERSMKYLSFYRVHG